MSSESQVNSQLGNWNGNILPIRGRKCLILMNDVTYYCLIFLDVFKRDIINLHELLFERLIEQFDYDSINFPGECSAKLKKELEPRFPRTNNNRKVLGTITEFIFQIEYLMELDYEGRLGFVNLPELNNKFTNNYVGALKPKV